MIQEVTRMMYNETWAQIKGKYPGLERLPEVECTVCGYFEVYYSDPVSNILVRTCPTCNYIQVIDVSSLPTEYTNTSLQLVKEHA